MTELKKVKPDTKHGKHGPLELLDVVERDELFRLLTKVVDLQKDGTLDKLLAVLEIMQKDQTIDKLYYKVSDLSEKGTVKKLLEGNLLDRTLESLVKMLQEGTLQKLLDLVIDLQKRGILDELLNYAPKLIVLLDKIFEMEKKGILKLEDINKMLDKAVALIQSGALDTLMDLLELAPALINIINSESVRELLAQNVPKLLALLEKLVELNKQGVLNTEAIGKILENSLQLIANGTFDKLIDLLTMLSALLDALNDDMIKSLGEKINKILELIGKLDELTKQGFLDEKAIDRLLEKLLQLIANGTVDKLVDLLTMLSALLDALNDDMIKSLGEKINKILELTEPSKL